MGEVELHGMSMMTSYQYEKEEIVRRPRRGRHYNEQREDVIKGIKMKIPTFQVKLDPKAYLERERKIEMIFDCHSFSK